MALTRRQLLVGGIAASVAGLYRCDRFRPDVVGGPYDVAVIGSGFAGTYLGLRTAGVGLETVIVEAAPEKGMDFVSTGVGNPFEGSNTGEIDYNINASRVIGLGGTSRHWTGRVVRLRPRTFGCLQSSASTWTGRSPTRIWNRTTVRPRSSWQ